MRRSFAMLAALVVAATSTVARAQPATTDHYQCYKVGDPLKVAGVVDLDSPQFGLAAGCKLGKALELCVPAAKRVISASSKATKAPITPLDVIGPPSPGDQLCYQVSCPKPFPSDQQVTDQFGTRTLGKLKTSRVCTPAYKGAPIVFKALEHHPYGSAVVSVDATSGTLKAKAGTTDTVLDSAELFDHATGVFTTFPLPPGGGSSSKVKYFWSQTIYGDDPFVTETTRTGGRVRWLLTSSLSGTQVTVVDASTTDVGAEFALAARFPVNLNTASPPVLRAVELSCGGTSVGTFAETVADDPSFELRAAVAPDQYSGEITPGAVGTTITVTMTFTGGCTPIDPPGPTGPIAADRLEVRATTEQMHSGLERAVILTNGAGVEIADEGAL